MTQHQEDETWSPDDAEDGLADHSNSRGRNVALFGSYNYSELRSDPERTSGAGGNNVRQAPFPLWMTVCAGSVFGALAAGCVLWSSLGHHGHVLVSAVGSRCTGPSCAHVSGSFDCEDGAERWASSWSPEKRAWCQGRSSSPPQTKAQLAPLEHNLHASQASTTRHTDPTTESASHLATRPVSETTTQTTTTTTSSTTEQTTTQSSTTELSTRPTTTTEALGAIPPIVQKPFKAMKGISYCPVPVKATLSLKSDDFMADSSKPLWASSGRGDLAIMRRLGANAVRLYGNNPELDHRAFLEEAHANGLSVIPGMSDFPYFQDKDGNCQTQGYNCYNLVKKQYAQNLERGFLLKDKRYHPALLIFNLINEPDLKMPQTSDSSTPDSRLMARTIISAFDAVLDAEREVGVAASSAINFTSTISFALCPACVKQGDAPALGQMLLIRDAMNHPERYGYTPRNNLADNYRRRWVNSFNTANDAKDLKEKFFDKYGVVFPATPVFIGEYHNLLKPLVSDIQSSLHLAEEMPLFLGISFFEFQIAYWKGGSEMAFGLFQLGGYPISKMRFLDNNSYTVWCLSPASGNGVELPVALAEAYGGQKLDNQELCLPQPFTVPLSPLGYNLISGLRDKGKLAAFLSRTAEHLGGEVVDAVGLAEFAKIYLQNQGPGFEFQDVVRDMPQSPWLKINPRAACVANPNASSQDVEAAIQWGCRHLSGGFSCDAIDKRCQSDAFAKGDWVFSRYYRHAQHKTSSLEQCNFGGAAVFASPRVHRRFSSACVLEDS